MENGGGHIQRHGVRNNRYGNIDLKGVEEMKESKKISHVEIYYDDSSMERISNEERADKKLTKKQTDWIISQCLSDFEDFRNRNTPQEEVTLDNYKEIDIDYFSDMHHSHFQMCISLLNSLS